MKDKKLLLVEDSEQVQIFNKLLFEREGFTVETSVTLEEARKAVNERMPDAIVLDIGMPDGNGLDFLRELRRTSKVPVLLLTGYDKDEDIIAGFDCGCNDYLPKPYIFGVLLARLNRLLQSAEQVPDVIKKGSLFLDVLGSKAFINGVDILLTQKEFALLLLFIQNEDKTVSAEYIYEKVWGQEMIGEARALKTHITHLRKKIAGSGYTIPAAVEGYRFTREAAAPIATP